MDLLVIAGEHSGDEHAARMVREARERDARTEEEAKAAQYAGDEDPYVKPRELDDDER